MPNPRLKPASGVDALWTTLPITTVPAAQPRWKPRCDRQQRAALRHRWNLADDGEVDHVDDRRQRAADRRHRDLQGGGRQIRHLQQRTATGDDAGAAEDASRQRLLTAQASRRCESQPPPMTTTMAVAAGSALSNPIPPCGKPRPPHPAKCDCVGPCHASANANRIVAFSPLVRCTSVRMPASPGARSRVNSARSSGPPSGCQTNRSGRELRHEIPARVLVSGGRQAKTHDRRNGLCRTRLSNDRRCGSRPGSGHRRP